MNSKEYMRFSFLGLKIEFTPSDLLKIYGSALYPLKGQFVQHAPVFEAGIGIYLSTNK